MGKKENISANKIALKRSFNEMALHEITLSEETYAKRDEKLHYIPNNLNQTILVTPCT